MTKLLFIITRKMNPQKNTKEAAETLGVSLRRVQQLIKSGVIPATKFGRDYLIDEADLSKVRVYAKRGRPKKETGDRETRETGNKSLENLTKPQIQAEKSESEIASQNFTKLYISPQLQERDLSDISDLLEPFPAQ